MNFKRITSILGVVLGIIAITMQGEFILGSALVLLSIGLMMELQ